MYLSTFKNLLSNSKNLTFVLPNGSYIPPHFHLTEVGQSTKNFIDCGGTSREESRINFQLWTANDFDHRLEPEKVLEIICNAEETLGLPDQEIEVEYQSETIGKYGLAHEDGRFILVPLETDCLAKEKCGIPLPQTIVAEPNCCSPDSGCC